MLDKEKVDKLIIALDNKMMAINKQEYEKAAKARDMEISIVKSIYPDLPREQSSEFAIRYICEYHQIPFDELNVEYNVREEGMKFYKILSDVLITYKIKNLLDNNLPR
jgi:hypothetical protein